MIDLYAKCIHNVCMSSPAAVRKPLGVRATPEQHRLLTEAATRENRSVSSFVLTAALHAAGAEPSPHRKTVTEVQAAIRSAQELMRPYQTPGRSLSEELSEERRAEAKLE
jgi:hypothetical protein